MYFHDVELVRGNLHACMHAGVHVNEVACMQHGVG